MNGPAKEFLKKKFEEWYAKEISSQMERGRDVYEVEVPLKLSVMKPIHLGGSLACKITGSIMVI